MERLTVYDSELGGYKARIDGHVIHTEGNNNRFSAPATWLVGEIVQRLAYYENVYPLSQEVRKKESS